MCGLITILESSVDTDVHTSKVVKSIHYVMQTRIKKGSQSPSSSNSLSSDSAHPAFSQFRGSQHNVVSPSIQSATVVCQSE